MLHWLIVLVFFGGGALVLIWVVAKLGRSAAPRNDVSASLQQLESLRRSGQISDAEYQRQRAEIIKRV